MDSTSSTDRTANSLSQDGSPLFRIPLEVRHRIYKLAFTEEPVPNGGFVRDMDKDPFDGASRAPFHNHVLPNWFRPGCTGRTKIHTELLRTCKLVYSEAWSIPLAVTVHKCYQGYGPGDSPSQYFTRFTQAQLTRIRHVQLFTQVGDFDQDGLWLRKELRPVAKNLEQLVITMRELGGAPNRPFLLNPYRRGEATRQGVDEFMEKVMGVNEKQSMPKTGWAGTFTHLPVLNTLIMELEDEESREDELEAQVDWASKWSFKHSGTRSMISKTAPSKRIWRRPQTHHHCHKHHYESPRIITWTVRWDAPSKRPVKAGQVKISKRQNSRAAHRQPVSRSNASRVNRPAYNPCLGGLNSIFAHASDETIDELTRWGVL